MSSNNCNISPITTGEPIYYGWHPERTFPYDGAVFPLTIGDGVFPLTIGDGVFPLTVYPYLYPDYDYGTGANPEHILKEVQAVQDQMPLVTIFTELLTKANARIAELEKEVEFLQDELQDERWLLQDYLDGEE